MTFIKQGDISFIHLAYSNKCFARPFRGHLRLACDQVKSTSSSCQKIELTQQEQQSFQFLRRAANSFLSTPPVELRVAGGWVRDKILGRHNSDIDIAVRNTTGAQFASHVLYHAKRLNQKEHLSFIGPLEYVPAFCTVKCIAAKPANSRHLETASVHLDDLNLDFVQLRTEDYTDSIHSRVPSTIKAGTPSEDAHRRDFTVNTLFYNLHSYCVEDWTGHGLADLSQGLLRTPLETSITLRDDPLRALRAIRFACKLGFRVHDSLNAALSSTELHSLIMQKVSRERVSYEILQVLESPLVVHGLMLISKYRLTQSIFLEAFGTNQHEMEQEFTDAVQRVEIGVGLFREALHICDNTERSLCQLEDQSVLVMALLAWDLSRIQPIIRDAFRQTKTLQRDVTHVVVLGTRLENLLRQWNFVDGIDSSIGDEAWIDLAEIVRNSGERLWLFTVIFGAVRSKVLDLLPKFIAVGLNEDVCKVEPAMNGNELKQGLDLRKGPEVGRAVRALVRLQLGDVRTSWKERQGKNTSASDEAVEGCDTEKYLQRLKQRITTLA